MWSKSSADPGAIPAELRERSQWVVWRTERRDGKPTKAPYSAATGQRASVDDPKTWGSFEQVLGFAMRANVGIGYVFTDDDPFAGLDFDGCMNGSGELHPSVREIVEQTDSYAERSPSGTGVHVIVRAELNGSRHRTSETPWGGGFEVYSSGRYFTFTGDRLHGDHAVERDIEGLLARLLPEREPPGDGKPYTAELHFEDAELLDRAFGARDGDRVRELYNGELAGSPSASEGDLAMMSAFAFWTGPGGAEQLDRLFRSSGRMRDKWGRADYREATIARALSRQSFYEPLSPEMAERTERSDANPHGERDSAFGRGDERKPNDDRTPPSLALESSILDRFDAAMSGLGLVGERHVARTVKLVQVSRLLKLPAKLVIKGDSSTGKSYAVECATKTTPPESLYVRTSASPLALFYSDESFEHKCIVFYEANRLGDDDDQLGQVLRTLISENRLAHEVTVPEKRSSTLLTKNGPVAFITTTCKPSLGAELETRILSLHSDNSDAMTQSVVRAILLDHADARPEPDLKEWHELDRWLASSGPREVVLPWAPALASFKLSGPPRLRRDISNLVSLAKAHALLHRATREQDDRGRIVSTLDDYETVRELLSAAMAVATDRAVRAGTREIVEAVAELRAKGKPYVSMSAASREAGRSKSTTHTDVHDALGLGYLVDRSPTPTRFDLDVGDPMPGEDELLPTATRVERAFGERSAGVQAGTERANPHQERDSGERSDRSVVSGDSGYEQLDYHADELSWDNHDDEEDE